MTRSAAITALTVLTVLNFLNYVDRYVLSAALVLMKRDPVFQGVTDAQFGLFQASFLVVYMIFSPVVGGLSDRIPRKYIVAGGVAIWSVATVWSGLAQGYYEMAAARALIGFGEAGYAAVAPAIISDLFNKDRRARMLAVFYTATPVGSALGFVLGGYLAQHYGWRWAFLAVGAPGLAFAIAALFIVEPRRGAQDGDAGPRSAPGVSFGSGAKSLLKNPRWLYVTAGSALMTFTVGGLAFWAPSYFQEVWRLDAGEAGLYFGGVTVLAGIIGTAAGGVLGDLWHRRDKGAYLKLSGLGLLLAAPALLAAPYAGGVAGSIALFFVGEVFVFLNTGPLNAALVESATPRIRELALGLNIFAIHLFGDAASPTILGAVSDSLRSMGLSAAAALSFVIAATSIPLAIGSVVLLMGARSFRSPAAP